MKRVAANACTAISKNGAPRPNDYSQFAGSGFWRLDRNEREQVAEKFKLLTHEWLEHIERGVAAQWRDRRSISRASRTRLTRHHRKASRPNVWHFLSWRRDPDDFVDPLELPLPRTNMFEIEYAGFRQVALLPGHAEIELLNFTPWRDAPNFT